MAINGTNGYAPLGDQALVVAFQGGDEAAYSEIYLRYADRVRRTCLRILNDPQDADEATQEAFLKAYQALSRFNGSYRLGAWLTRIAANVSIDLLRTKTRSAQLVALPDEQELPEREGGPEDLVVGEYPRVTLAMDDIQPLHARALELRAVEGMSHHEMAGTLAMTPGQVKALLHRARRSFRRAWDKAEGWAVAPFLWVRTRASRSSDGVSQIGAGSAPNLALLGSANVPLFVERVAASAVLVAAALTGLQTTATSTALDPIARDTIIENRAAADPSDQDAADRVTTPLANNSKATIAAEALALPGVESIVGSQSDSLKPSDTPREDDDADEPVPGGPTASDARKLQKKVEKTIDDLTHLQF